MVTAATWDELLIDFCKHSSFFLPIQILMGIDEEKEICIVYRRESP